MLTPLFKRRTLGTSFNARLRCIRCGSLFRVASYDTGHKLHVIRLECFKFGCPVGIFSNGRHQLKLNFRRTGVIK